MKIKSVRTNKRKKVFEIHTRDRDYVFPFAKLELRPTPDDPIEEVFADPDLGEEGFSYRLRSGAEDTIHLDQVREFSQDPDYLAELSLELDILLGDYVVVSPTSGSP